MMGFKILLSTVFAFLTTVGFCAPADFVGSSSSLSIDHTTTVPGDTLKAGSYSISVTEQLADRMIVRIDSTTSKNHAIFLGVPSTATKMGGGVGAVVWGVGLNKTPTIRGFVFPNGNAVEFVYPKAEAAGLAKDNGAVVIAVDPRSEGKVALKNLSQDELQIVNLWLLSMTATGPDNKTPAVLARRYDGPQSQPQPAVATSVQLVYTPTPPTAVVPPAPVQRAALAPAPIVQRPQAGKKASRIATKAASQAPPQVASLDELAMPKAARQAPVIAQLPHTASSLPVIWMIGLFGLLGAALVRVVRRMSEHIQG